MGSPVSNGLDIMTKALSQNGKIIARGLIMKKPNPIAQGKFGVLDADRLSRQVSMSSITRNKVRKLSREYILTKENLDKSKCWTVKEKQFSLLSFTYRIWARKKRRSKSDILFDTLNDFYTNQMGL